MLLNLFLLTWHRDPWCSLAPVPACLAPVPACLVEVPECAVGLVPGESVVFVDAAQHTLFLEPALSYPLEWCRQISHPASYVQAPGVCCYRRVW